MSLKKAVDACSEDWDEHSYFCSFSYMPIEYPYKVLTNYLLSSCGIACLVLKQSALPLLDKGSKDKENDGSVESEEKDSEDKKAMID